MFKQIIKNLSFVCFALLMGINGYASSLNISKNDLVFANYRDIRDLNPHLYAGELFAQNLIFESLLKIENDGSFTPWLATHYHVSEDGKTYTFTLRDDVYFTDNTKFDAVSAKANFDALLDNVQRHGWLESVRLMKQYKDSTKKDPIEAKGNKLIIHLAQSYYPFLTEISMTRPFRFLSPKAFIDGTTKNGVSAIVGTGAYVLKKNAIDQYSVFEANEKYWGKKPKIKRIIAKVIPEKQTRTLALRNGEVDLIYGGNMVDAETFEEFKRLKNYKTAMSKPLATRMLLMNTTKKALKDLRVRQAIMHATDKEKISKGLFSSIESPADTLLSPNVPYANVGLKPYEFSFDKANKLLDEAGWKKVDGKAYRQKNSKTLEIVLNYDTNKATDKSVAEFLQSEYKKVGIKLKLLGEEEQAYRDRMKANKFDFTFNISWGTPYDPQSFIGSMRNPVYGDYFAQEGLKNKKELDQNILDALESTDEVKRQAHYKYVLETLHNQAVYLPLTYQRNLAVFNKKVKNVDFNPSQFEIPMEKMEIQN